ncbi:uncharacterized protein LOC132707925 [Cylas formicarius]|uniref:uncharacterized protein LOC132707925 n=1 Tax=Cylas formicarius TaxID=197179 RepID=UPI002958AC0C|nr:uncharacterized protein LOC132707925 [Cylas formicarius]
MSLKKEKDLQMICSLNWKNEKPEGAPSLIGLYDIPATTLNWEVFKSYLLKHSGTTGHDVQVSYLVKKEEYPINSQSDFQVALYMFRRKARAGETINFLLERQSNQPTHKNLRHSKDVETQFDNNDKSAFITTCCRAESPPEWFLQCLAQLKKEITEDVTANVSGVVSTALAGVKPQIVNPPNCYHHSRKSKTEKRLRKLNPHLVDSNTDAKDLIKSLKLDNKLEKLERKATKYKEKRFALFSAAKSSDSEAGHSSSRSRSHEKEDSRMGAQPVNVQEVVPHMLGGEVYLHKWEVINTGEIAWSSKTYLQYTWGSRALEPLSKIITVPYLKPGDQGTISVRFQIPNEPGRYECYWQFMHKGRRFGHWLGCQVVVDPFDLKGNRSVLETSGSTDKYAAQDEAEGAVSAPEDLIQYCRDMSLKDAMKEFTRDYANEIVKSKPAKKNQIKFEDEDLDEEGGSLLNVLDGLNVERNTIASSDSDNQSILSFDGSNCSTRPGEEFVMVPVPDCFNVDSPTMVHVTGDLLGVGKKDAEGKDGNYDNNNNTESGNKNIVYLEYTTKREEGGENVKTVVGFSESGDNSTQCKEDFMFIHVDGQKVLVPKNILNSEVISRAQLLRNAATPKTTEISPAVEPENPLPYVQPLQPTTSATIQQDSQQPDQSEANPETDYMSHCSAAGSCFSYVNSEAERTNRLFIFPKDCPGYEVVYPVIERDESGEPIVPDMSTSSSVPARPEDPAPGANIVHIPNFQQTPPEMRTSPTPTTTPSAPQQPAETVAQSVPSKSHDQQPHLSQPRPPHTVQETIMTGAASAASSAINTARSVINNIMRPQSPGTWINGHWVNSTPQSERETKLQILEEMGFWNRDLNATLLARFNDDVPRVVAELVQ